MSKTRALTREKLVELARALPPAPRVFAELNALLKDTNTDLDRITELIKRDAALAANIIRVSNSVAFRSEIRSGSIEEAVGRVGFGEVYRIVGFVAVQRLADQALLYYDVSAERLRDQMLETAFVCEALADRCQLDPRSAYTAGLMRPIGILLLDRVAQLLDVAEGYSHERDGSFLRWEGLNFGMSSTEVAAIVLAEWEFPADIVSAIREQYLTPEGPASDRLACLLNLASGALAADGRVLDGEAKHWAVTDEKLAVLGLSRRDFTQASERACRAFDAFRSERTKAARASVAEVTPPRPFRLPEGAPVPPAPAPALEPAASAPDELIERLLSPVSAPGADSYRPEPSRFRQLLDSFAALMQRDPRDVRLSLVRTPEPDLPVSAIALLWGQMLAAAIAPPDEELVLAGRLLVI